MTSLAQHLQRGLRREGIAARVEPSSRLAPELEKEKLAFLVGFDRPTDAEIATLRSFCARGGRLVVFYSSSPALANLLGVRPVGYATAPTPGAWSRMDFAATAPVGTPQSVLQTSSVLQRAQPIPGRSRVIATWSDRRGRTAGEPAWLASATGYWMTHVLLPEGDEEGKARLLGALAGSIDPRLWNVRDHEARKATERSRLMALARLQMPRENEIHAVWDHSGCGLYPGDWPRTFRVLKASQVTDLFVNVAGAGFAHYPSAVLPRSRTFAEEGDQLSACLAAARGSGIRVHAWVLCFTATRATTSCLSGFRRRGWCLTTREGAASEYLNPANGEVQNHILAAIAEIQSRYAVSGIHLDFVRWFERAPLPANAAAVVTGFVRAARDRVQRPKWLTVAVLGKYPACAASVGQDWDLWLGQNLVDYVVPMDYTEDLLAFETLVRKHADQRSHASRTIVGIGVTANESRLDVRQVLEQAAVVRRYGLAGISLFDLDLTLERQILPYLAVGLWKK